ncbi:AAA family ATPase [Burkholderia pseudomallei]|uniref:AAA family ATPase n=1 Tax=Burkholderia pseudomallei TaxID=28450 RepID=UPI0006178472|nr:AAA family ATPase [Burkholderia pseudomallei]KKB69255.1 AAA domain protein [Burkholderia pseudomallei MSHR1079]ONB82551.1 anticodon nuclease [Burkholderia pseudomallei]
MKPGQTFADLPTLAALLRQELEGKKTILLYAYNGTGKTRLSMAFKDIGKRDEARDTLYFNAFTEDLFHWDNDLDGDSDRRLTLNAASRFFAGLAELEMDNRIRPLLQRYADFDFRIDTQEWVVRFSRSVGGKVIDNIKVSRGEENIFVWCFFLAIVQLVLDGAEAYQWVKYIYIDDPISSLDEHNAIAVANHLAQLLKRPDSKLKTVLSTHHTLFFNVLFNELKNAKRYFINKDSAVGGYVLREETGDTPFFHHVAALAELYQAANEDRLFTHHFNMLRTILEKTASFHGHKNFSACIKQEDDDPDGILHARLINILSHGNYSLYEPQQMLDENKAYFKKILHNFLNRYPFNSELFPQSTEVADTQ